MPRLEVRCCCEPQKLLGWWTGPINGRYVTMTRVPYDKKKTVSFADDPPPLIENRSVSWIRLPVAKISTDSGYSMHDAIKAEGMKLEDFMEVVGFEPNKGD